MTKVASVDGSARGTTSGRSALRLHRHVYLLTIVFAGLTFAHQAVANNEAYQESVKAAVDEFERGHWNEAVVLFQRAHHLSPSARTLRGMGVAAFEARRYAESVNWLTAALAHPVEPLTSSLREQVNDVLERARQFVGTFEVEITPEDATFTVDGSEPVIVDGRLQLDPGTHRVVAEAEGYRTASHEVYVRGGQRGTLRLHLKETADSSPTLVEQPDKADEPPVEQPSTGNVAPWLLVGGGAALAITGGVFLGLAAQDIDTVENMEGTGREIEAAQQRVPVRSGVGFGLAAAGLVAAGVGVAWLTLGGSDEDAEADGVVVGIRPGGLAVRGAF